MFPLSPAVLIPTSAQTSSTRIGAPVQNTETVGIPVVTRAELVAVALAVTWL
jgi:hypothetical protein